MTRGRKLFWGGSGELLEGFGFGGVEGGIFFLGFFLGEER